MLFRHKRIRLKELLGSGLELEDRVKNWDKTLRETGRAFRSKSAREAVPWAR
ncbi:hypothetical protein PR003_g20378 [Phytophthora rubi]|uniref:Uncharacterized protein n=1 Tax=Phytophthora rubi TaxID=129364 RepID=A0A6A3JYX3_9STRA|nr:hypothetical protein PR002_g23263 [Phytophthora rubi]KAE8998567.1 hypothetical protein PR001_g19289 [Phytophthora rubi]KAE9309971.1 hypothetical protein PR003_g20378 [Phytophthora rubi]